MSNIILCHDFIFNLRVYVSSDFDSSDKNSVKQKQTLKIVLSCDRMR